MKTLLRLIALAALACAFSGCVAIDAGSAAKFKNTMSLPMVFSDTVEASGIAKHTDEATGRVTRRAKLVRHELTILGFTRAAEYEGVEIKTKPAPAK